VKQQRNAILWAIGWWLVRRQIRRRAAVAVAGVGATATATAQRGRTRVVLGAVLLVGLIAAGLVAARKLLGGGEAAEMPPSPDEPVGRDVPAVRDVPDEPPEPTPDAAPA
jgi:hypothetical protein